VERGSVASAGDDSAVAGIAVSRTGSASARGTGAPQWTQNFISDWSGWPQALQFMVIYRDREGRDQ
jgi:hypothetical protein